MSPPKLTPMLKQYLSIKEAYPDTILFYRMGDFYEMFDEDARIAALTSCAMVNPWEYLKLHDFDGYHPNKLAISDKVIQKLMKKDIFVNPYTVNSEEQLKRFINDKVSGIITDVPDIAVRVRDSIQK